MEISSSKIKQYLFVLMTIRLELHAIIYIIIYNYVFTKIGKTGKSKESAYHGFVCKSTKAIW